MIISKTRKVTMLVGTALNEGTGQGRVSFTLCSFLHRNLFSTVLPEESRGQPSPHPLPSKLPIYAPRCRKRVVIRMLRSLKV